MIGDFINGGIKTRLETFWILGTTRQLVDDYEAQKRNSFYKEGRFYNSKDREASRFIRESKKGDYRISFHRLTDSSFALSYFKDRNYMRIRLVFETPSRTKVYISTNIADVVILSRDAFQLVARKFSEELVKNYAHEAETGKGPGLFPSFLKDLDVVTRGISREELSRTIEQVYQEAKKIFKKR